MKKLGWYSRYRLQILQSTPEEAVKIAAKRFWIWMSGIFVVTLIIMLIFLDFKEALFVILPTLIAFAIATLFGYLFFRSFAKFPFHAFYEKLYETLGRKPSKEEITELYLWEKLGKTPTLDSIQELMPRYLNYIETTYNGTYSNTYTTSKKYKYYLLILGILAFLNGTFSLLSGHASIFIIILDYLSALLLLWSFFVLKPTQKPRRVPSFIYRRKLKKIADMRKQLEE